MELNESLKNTEDREIVNTKVVRAELKEKIRVVLRLCKENRIEEAIDIKNEVMKSRVKLTLQWYNKLYEELLYGINSYEEIVHTLREMAENNISLSVKVCPTIINKCIDYNQLTEILSLFEMFNIMFNIKMYTAIVANLMDNEKVLDVYNQIKNNYLVPDIRILDLIISKLKGDKEQYKFIYIKFITKVVEEKSKKIEDYNAIIKTIEELEELDIEMSVDIYNLIISYIDNIEIVKILLEIMEINNIKPNVETYVYIMDKLISKECLGNYKDILEEIESSFDKAEHNKMQEVYRIRTKFWGGSGKVVIYKEKLAKEMKAKIDKKDDFINQTYKLGIINGLTEVNSSFSKNRKSIINMQDELKDDIELYKYDIKNLEGEIAGIDLSEQLYKEYLEKKIPLKIIAYISSDKVLESIESTAISNFFYKSSYININESNVNSFNFTSSFDEFDKIVDRVDYEKYDVAVFIITDLDSRAFIESNTNVSYTIDKLENLLEDKICNIRFVKNLDNDYCKSDNIFKQMCKEHKMSSKAIVLGAS